MDHERLLPYLEEARPEIVQIGRFGIMRTKGKYYLIYKHLIIRMS